MILSEITRCLESHAPLALQESYDNAGILVGDPGMDITRALITLDVTEEVLDEAVNRGCNLVIAHHPVIFKPLKRITGSDETEKLVARAIREGIALYAIHTNLDNAERGVSTSLAEALGLKNLKVLQPARGMLRKLVTFCPHDHADRVRQALFEAGAGRIGNYASCSFNVSGKGTFLGMDGTNPYVGEVGNLHLEEETRIETVFPSWLVSTVVKALLDAHPYEEVAYDIYPLENEFSLAGMGVTGEMAEGMDETAFLHHVKTTTGAQVVRHSHLNGKTIRKVAVCGGSGSFLIRQAMAAGADAFVTGDLKYHEFFEPGKRLLLVDAGHYETEQFAKGLIHSVLSEKIPNFATFISEICTNPISCL